MKWTFTIIIINLPLINTIIVSTSKKRIEIIENQMFMYTVAKLNVNVLFESIKNNKIHFKDSNIKTVVSLVYF